MSETRIIEIPYTTTDSYGTSFDRGLRAKITQENNIFKIMLQGKSNLTTEYPYYEQIDTINSNKIQGTIKISCGTQTYNFNLSSIEWNNLIADTQEPIWKNLMPQEKEFEVFNYGAYKLHLEISLTGILIYTDLPEFQDPDYPQVDLNYNFAGKLNEIIEQKLTDYDVITIDMPVTRQDPYDERAFFDEKSRFKIFIDKNYNKRHQIGKYIIVPMVAIILTPYGQEKMDIENCRISAQNNFSFQGSNYYGTINDNIQKIPYDIEDSNYKIISSYEIYISQRNQHNLFIAGTQAKGSIPNIPTSTEATEFKFISNKQYNFLTPYQTRLQNPALVSPSTTPIDVSLSQQFSFVFSGDKITACSIGIYNIEDNKLLYYNPFVRLPNIVYNNDLAKIIIDNLYTLSAHKIFNNQEYYWKIRMSNYDILDPQYQFPEADLSDPVKVANFYEDKPNYETIGYYFRANTNPTVQTKVNNVILSDNNIFLDSNHMDLQISYSQAENIPIKYFSFYLQDAEGNLIQSTEKVFSSNIVFNYDGFINGQTYLLECIIENQIGQIITKTFPIKVTYINMPNFQDFQFTLKNNTNINSIEIIIPQNVTNGLQYLRANNVERIQINRKANYQTFSGKIAEYNLEDIIEDSGNYIVQDYSACNNQEYTYFIYPITATQIGEPIVRDIITDWEGYTLYPLIEKNNKYYYNKLPDGNIEVWRFMLNAKEEEMTINQDKTIHTGFAEKPKIALGDLNYLSGGLECLLGQIYCNVEENYYEPKSLMVKWLDFIKHNSTCLFKNPKGDAMIVFITENNYNYMNVIANKYKNNVLDSNQVTSYPTTIKFNYVEIADLNKLTTEQI